MLIKYLNQIQLFHLKNNDSNNGNKDIICKMLSIKWKTIWWAGRIIVKENCLKPTRGEGDGEIHGCCSVAIGMVGWYTEGTS